MLNIVKENNGIYPMITPMKSTHGSVPFKDSVDRLYIAAYMLNIVKENNGISPMITPMKSTHGSVPLKHSVDRLYIAAYMLNIVERVLTWGEQE